MVAALLVGCQRSSRPHVVMIIIDTLRADRLGVYGHPLEVSPELDALAREGVRFESVLAQSSWTRPSIGSLLTSRYPRTLGLYKERNQALPTRFLTLAEALRAEGYATFGATANPNINSTYNFHQGFDRYRDSTVRMRWMVAESEKPTSKEQALQPANELFDAALDFAADTSGPVYVQIDLMEVHEYGHHGHREMIRPEFHQLFPDAPDRAYLRAVRQASFDIGAFVRRWLEVPSRSNTLFVLLSDHGEGLQDHPEVRNSDSHGALLYGSNLWVPWVLYHPAAELAPRSIAADVRLLDVMPTVLAYLGVPPPPETQGVSLLSLITGIGSAPKLPEVFVAETERARHEKIAAYGREWKYIENRRSHPGTYRRELQPLWVAENGRRTDRIRQQPEVAAPLRSFLADWERRFPKAPSTPVSEALPAAALKQLRSLGYLD